MTRFLLISILCSILLASCSPSAPKKAADIDKLENELRESSKKNIADTAKVRQLMTDYRDYAKNFSSDSLAPVYLMKLAKFYGATHQTDSAINVYDQVYKNYPSYPKISFALFSEAFLYNNEKHNTAKAGELYQEYLTKYPNTPLASSATAELHNLGKTPDQIMAEMDSINRAKADSITANK
jgi:outer membrane protein assembly factor BamD (BamD/ComL family)